MVQQSEPRDGIELEVELGATVGVAGGEVCLESEASTCLYCAHLTVVLID